MSDDLTTRLRTNTFAVPAKDAHEAANLIEELQAEIERLKAGRDEARIEATVRRSLWEPDKHPFPWEVDDE